MINDRAKKLGEGLVAAKILTPAQLEEAVSRSSKPDSPSLIVNLLDSDLLTYQVFEKFVNHSLGIKSAIIASRKLDTELVKLVGEGFIKTNHIFPMAVKKSEKGKTLALAMVDPLDSDTLEAVEKKTGFQIMPVLVSLPDFKQTLKVFFGGPTVDLSPPQPEGTANPAKSTAKAALPPLPSLTPPIPASVAQPSSDDAAFIGATGKRFREEVLAKLDLPPHDARTLKKEQYTRHELFEALNGMNLKGLQSAWGELKPAQQFEALANTLIKVGIITRRDLIISGAVAAVFGEQDKK